MGEPRAGTPLSDAVILANAYLVNAKTSLSVKRVAIVSVVSSVKAAVDSVLQTTIDQLNTALPDGSAFAKTSRSRPPAPVPSAGSPAIWRRDHDRGQRYGPHSDSHSGPHRRRDSHVDKFGSREAGYV